MHWHTRGYYGTVKHNAKAIYQHYLGWYDANPANLDPLPRQESGRKMIAYMGGIDAAVARARDDFAKAEFRWVAQVMSHAVFGDPSHVGARALLADAFEQLGYLAESSTWRNAYLFGALELREGMRQIPMRPAISSETVPALSDLQIFNTFATRLDGPKAAGRHIRLNWHFTDAGTRYCVALENAVLHAEPVKAAVSDARSIATSRQAINAIVCGQQTFDDAIQSGAISGDGVEQWREIISLLEPVARMFEIVEPRRESRT